MAAKVQIGPEDTKRLKQCLAVERDQLKIEINEELAKESQSGYSQIIGVVKDRGDESVADLYSDLNVANIERHVTRLKAIENALFNKTEETFGICEDCALPIDKQRLEVDPAVSRCLDCQTLYESTPTAKDVTPSL